MSSRNMRCIKLAEAAFNVYCEAHPGCVELVDLLTDLLHLAEDWHEDPIRLVAMAMMHYREEKRCKLQSS